MIPMTRLAGIEEDEDLLTACVSDVRSSNKIFFKLSSYFFETDVWFLTQRRGGQRWGRWHLQRGICQERDEQQVHPQHAQRLKEHLDVEPTDQNLNQGNPVTDKTDDLIFRTPRFPRFSSGPSSAKIILQHKRSTRIFPILTNNHIFRSVLRIMSDEDNILTLAHPCH